MEEIYYSISSEMRKKICQDCMINNNKSLIILKFKIKFDFQN